MDERDTPQPDNIGGAEGAANVIPFPKLFQKDGAVWANSRDVAEYFGKSHRHVLRDVRNLLESLHGPSLGAAHGHAWFRTATYLDENARERPSFDMTKDGFVLLVMGWNGAEFVKAKVEYINRFNEMEASLQKIGSVVGWNEERLALADAFERLGERLIGRLSEQDTALAETSAKVDTLVTKVDDHGNKIIGLQLIVNGIIRRRNPSPATKSESIRVVDLHPFNGKCPCCRKAAIVDRGKPTREFSWDHWTENPWKNAPHEGWAVCKDCNLGTLKTARDSYKREFELYQSLRRELAEQGGLFGEDRFARKRIAGAA